MNLLTTLGLLAIAVTVAFTAIQFFGASGPAAGQTRRSSIIEAWINVVIGFTINFFANFAILPLIGATFTPGQNFWMGCIYTAVSVLRSYVIRRWFNSRLHSLAQRLAF